MGKQPPECYAADGFKLLGLETRASVPKDQRSQGGAFTIYNALTPGRIVTNSSSLPPEHMNAKLESSSK